MTVIFNVAVVFSSKYFRFLFVNFSLQAIGLKIGEAHRTSSLIRAPNDPPALSIQNSNIFGMLLKLIYHHNQAFFCRTDKLLRNLPQAATTTKFDKYLIFFLACFAMYFKRSALQIQETSNRSSDTGTCCVVQSKMSDFRGL